MPTKTEQSDLLMALFGRHGEAPLPVLAAQSPADCFYAAIEAMKIAVKWMTPVILLTDGYLGERLRALPDPGSEGPPEGRAEVPDDAELRRRSTCRTCATTKLIRPWAVPGTPGLEHRIGGLEKDSMTGMVSYDGMNHERMVKTRAQKIRNVVEDVPDVEVFGAQSRATSSSSPGAARSARSAAPPRSSSRRARRSATSTCAG